MIPYSIKGTNERDPIFPLVTLLLIATNVAVFIHELQLEAQSDAVFNSFILRYSLVPCQYSFACAVPDGAAHPFWLTLITSMFLHAGWLHLIGNMFFLLRFGGPVESAFGHLRYLLFYLLAGLVASAAEIATSVYSTIPGLGASGAIAGVLAAFLVLYPHSKVRTPLPFVSLFFPIWLPAWLMIGGWFAIQFINGWTALSTAAGDATGGVAYWAHIGGFVGGLILVWGFRQESEPQPQRYRGY